LNSREIKYGYFPKPENYLLSKQLAGSGESGVYSWQVWSSVYSWQVWSSVYSWQIWSGVYSWQVWRRKSFFESYQIEVRSCFIVV